MVANVDEIIQTMKIQLKNIKIEVKKTKTLKVALASNNELVTKLQTDLDKHVSSIFAKSKENDTLSIWVAALEKSVADTKAKFDDLSLQFVVEQTKNKIFKEEKNSVEDKLTSTNEEVANLKKIVAR